MSERIVVFVLPTIEANYLAGLIREFVILIEGAETEPDFALERLTPPAYRDDDEAAEEFRRLTAADTLNKRLADAHLVLTSLAPHLYGDEDPELDDDAEADVAKIAIAPSEVDSWLRTLTALRLVIATRLGIDDSGEPEDPSDQRLGVYDWLAYRLEGLLRATEQ